MISNDNPSKGLNFEEIWYFGAGHLTTSNPKTQKNANIRVLGVGMYRLWRSPATWCLGGGLGICSSNMIIGFVSEPFSWQDFFWETTASSWNICDYQDELLQRFRRKNIRGVVFVGVMYLFIMLQPSIVLTYVETTYILIQKILYNHPGKI